MKKESLLFAMIIVTLVLVHIFIGLLSGLLTHESSAIEALENQGFSNIWITDKQWFFVLLRGCWFDSVKFTAHAVNPAYKDVEIFVCIGWPFRGATVKSN